MKKNLLLFLFAFLCYGMNAQVLSFTTDAIKEYEDNTRTSYLTLVGVVPAEIRPVIEIEIKSKPDVLNFSFYDNTNLMKCMFSSAISVDEKQIVEMINDVIEKYSLSNTNQEIQQIGYKEADYAVKFKVSGIKDAEHRQNLINHLNLNDNIISVDINIQNICKMVITKGTDISFIEKLFSELGLKISEINNN